MKRLLFFAAILIAFAIAGTIDYNDHRSAVCDTDMHCQWYDELKPEIKSVLTDKNGNTIYSWR